MVIGTIVRDQVFGEGANPIGQIVRINNQPFRVMGVLGQEGAIRVRPGPGRHAGPRPTPRCRKRLLGTSHLSNILVAINKEAASADVTASVSDLLRRRHRIAGDDTDDFNVRSPEEMARVLSSTTDTMAYLLASVAAISLVVGGIGIMNIMLVSVTERTKEIGLRRALGAKRTDVLRQFVAEALSLSLAGGTLGVSPGCCLVLRDERDPAMGDGDLDDRDRHVVWFLSVGWRGVRVPAGTKGRCVDAYRGAALRIIGSGA